MDDEFSKKECFLCNKAIEDCVFVTVLIGRKDDSVEIFYRNNQPIGMTFHEQCWVKMSEIRIPHE